MADKETGFYTDAIIINQDLNFNTTLYRALKSSNYQSLQVLIQYIQEEEKTANMAASYNDVFMIDFQELIEKKTLQLAFYLNEPEKLSFENEAACNME